MSKSPTKKVKAVAPPEDEPDAKQPFQGSAEDAAAAIVGAASKITTSAKAAAKGEGAIERTEITRPPRASNGLVLVHWNVGGLNGLLTGKSAEERMALLKALVDKEQPDVLAISEHKLTQAKVADNEKKLLKLLPGYTAHWCICTAKNGYSGVVALVKEGLTPTVALDTICPSMHEGRTITLSFDDMHAVLAYVPNSGQDLKRLDERIKTWEPAMRAHLKALAASNGKPVVLLGDLNVAHLDADIWNVTAKHIPKSAGTTPKERAAFGELLADGPYVDCFRHLHPDAEGCFSYWSTRSGNQLLNRGLRLDYAVASESLTSGAGGLKLHDCAYLAEYAPNGDHAPSLVAIARA